MDDRPAPIFRPAARSVTTRLSRIYVGSSGRLGRATREPHRLIKQRKQACYRQLLLVHLINEEWTLDVLLAPLPFRRIQFAPGSRRFHCSAVLGSVNPYRRPHLAQARATARRQPSTNSRTSMVSSTARPPICSAMSYPPSLLLSPLATRPSSLFGGLPVSRRPERHPPWPYLPDPTSDGGRIRVRKGS